MEAARKKDRLMTKKRERRKQPGRGARGERGSDKTLVAQTPAVTMWESNPADASFGAASYYPAAPLGSQPMLTEQNNFVPTDFFNLAVGYLHLHAALLHSEIWFSYAACSHKTNIFKKLHTVALTSLFLKMVN